MSDILIRADNVSKVFHSHKEDVEAIHDFSLTVKKGEIVCIVEASGCGKSTFLNMVAGFIQPSSGRILLEGQEITKVEPRCGIIFQNYALFPWMTVIENITFGPRLKGVQKKVRHEQAKQWIKRVGLEGFDYSYPGELSGGMQQRVALTRALANEPDVLLCDEPFGALDAMTRQAMQHELLRLMYKSNQTILFITHSIDEALILSDRVVIMSARPGRVKAVFENDLPRPRKLELQLADRYLELKRKVWSLVEEEVVSVLGIRKG